MHTDVTIQVAKTLFETVQNDITVDSEVVDLIVNMTDTVDCIVDVPDLPTRAMSIVEQVLRQITNCCTFVREHIGLGFSGRMNLLGSYEDMANHMDVLNKLKKQLYPPTSSNGKLSSEEVDLSGLLNLGSPLAQEVKYPSNTCHNLIARVTKLLLSTSHRSITWLWGPSGCGKSTISFTLLEYFNSISRLAAYIHLDHGSESPFPIIGSIAYKLAAFDPEFRRVVTGFLEQRHEQLSFETQFKKYLLGPLREGACSTAVSIVFIIDGLDESKNCEEFLQLLSSGIFSQLPQNFRFLIINGSITSSLFFNDSIYKIQLYENNDDTPITATTSSPQVSTPSSKSEPVPARVFEPELLFDYFVVKKNIKFERKTFILCENLVARYLMFMNTQMESIILPQNSSVLSVWNNPDALKELAETVPPSLRLVCSSWSSALKNSTFSVRVLNMLSQFVYNKLLIWVEIMSLIGKYDEIEPALMHVTNWILDNDIELTDFLLDARDLVTKYQTSISQSAYQIYLCMLYLERGQSSIADHYRSNAVSDIRIERFEESSDGERVVSGSGDGTIRIWDSITGNLVAGPFEGHINPVISVAFSPDGKRVVSRSSDWTIKIRDTATGKLVARPFGGHTDWVHSVSFSPDGKRVASGSKDRTIRIWEAANENCIACSFDGHTNFSRFAAYKSEATSVTSGLNVETAEIRSNLSNDAVLRDCLPQESLQTRSGSSSTCGTDTTVCDSHNNPEVAWSLEDDGWIKGELGEYLLWIPEDLRRYICKPGDGAFATQKKLGYCLKVNIHGK
ncbi:WD40 domain containing protein [Pyrrhoderma noxium]|uniref:WD40 domain containing protein n=1 Tax=Pyrrhoderma noxium TaxID=2282107 RepID=A0A286USW9_9AGAM|nr:WD40 domain containing protein [Pyrrhoderma noxium]